VPWCPNAWHLAQRPVFTLEPAFHAGSWYVQEAASMAVAGFLPPGDDPLTVLDLCAAPGGKATLLADAVPAGSVVVANEAIRSRVGLLTETTTRWGHAHLVVTHNDPKDFGPLAGSFDAVFVDAPCSGEGLWRRRPQGIADYSAAQIAHCAARQERILAAALPLVRAGGVLVYSTCTWAEAENEAQIAALVRTHGHRLAPLARPDLLACGWVETEAAGFPCYRAYPHRVAGEGLFVAGVQVRGQAEAPESVPAPRRPVLARVKPPPELAAFRELEGRLVEADGQWAWQPAEVAQWLAEHGAALRIAQAGVALGQIKGRDFVPDHAWALAADLPQPYPALEVEREHALIFLKKESLPDANGAGRGFYRVAFEGLGLGWIKHVGHRSNNLLPKSWRILRDLDAWEE
jgi:NOL1/NOP2/fmu family ribosome biogenesis protein